MSDVKLVKTLELKKRGRPPVVVTNVDEEKLVTALKNKKLSKKELTTVSGVSASVVAKFLKENPSVVKDGDKKGTKYTVL